MMDMNHDAREAMNRWRHRQKTAERRVINFNERVQLHLDAIQDRMVTDRESLEEWQFRQVYYRDVGQYDPIDADWRVIRVGDGWGGVDVSAFFKRDVTIPERMSQQRVFLRLYVGGDSLVRVDGVPHHGLDPFRNQVLLCKQAEAGKTYAIELESYIYWYPAEGVHNRFQQAELVTIDAEIESTYWDFVAVFKALFIHNIDPNLQTFLQDHLWDALKIIPIYEQNPDVFQQCLRKARQQLQDTVYSSDKFRLSGKLHLVGHSHLDIVYHWTHREYIRKIGRTHATMLRMIEQYDGFKFSQSSAKIYADMKEHYPEIYEQVKACITEGSWQPVGAFWLEPDCNLISGESFVRHILYGQQFWQTEFGFQSRVCWQPDVFGMTWALPQILSRCGIDVVLTNKLYVWNDTNKWHQNDFWWEGPDGSRVFTVIPPGHFIGFVDPDHMSTYWQAFSDKHTISEMIYIYGWGDGGGGVDPEMLECAQRYQNFPGLVSTQFNHPEDTLLHLADKAADAQLPVWRDELYLETHRGTYTSKGALKKHNRQSEVLLQQIEMLAALAWVNGADYPQQKLDKTWKLLLSGQFHDALPGTHITAVYHDLLKDYETLYQNAQTIRETALAQLLGELGENLLIYNLTFVARDGVTELSLTHLPAGVPHQTVEKLDGAKAVLVSLREPLQGIGYRVLPHQVNVPTLEEPELLVTENTLENRYLRATFNAQGELTSLWDKEAQRETIVAGQVGNQFTLYEDRPGKYDAWDIVASYVEYELPLMSENTLTIDEQGVMRVSLRLVRQFYQSTITQRIALTAASRVLTFETKIDWQERQRLLKVGFPVAVNTHQATYDIAYGTIERAAHRNTSYDRAKFEVPAHWWMDMSEPDYGVALLNNCKYGHEANGQQMRLTLLKGSISPDPQADIGLHHFTYALYPHLGDWRAGKVHAEATKLNVPLVIRKTALPPQDVTLIHCDAPNITVEAVKRAEDGQRLIVRLVERENKRTYANLKLHYAIQDVVCCDLMENVEKPITHEAHTVHVTLNPRDIVTLAIQF